VAALVVFSLVALTGCGGKRRSNPSVGNISGRITSTSGAPVFDAKVSLAGTSTVANTNYDGRYSITGVPAGQKVLSIVKQGYQSTQASVTMPSNGTVTGNATVAPNANAGAVQGVVSFE
jgi:hypothetical protein